MTRRLVVIVLGLIFALPSAAVAESGDFRPEAVAVKRYGAGYRYPQAGWWVVHIEGEPYERGVQHGRLLASEIAAHIRCFAQMYSSDAPADSWKLLKVLGDSLFLPKFDREYLEEMRGIADGASAAGAKFDGRPLDLSDIATLNLWPEIMTLPWATQAMPTGLEGTKYEEKSEKGAKGGAATASPAMPPKPGHCSAFAATGPATADGKIVFGHITMFSLYPSTFYNIWLDVKPTHGHRVAMQTFPGGIHSGMDYYMNSAGILCSETTIDQTRLNAAGAPLSSRIRKALQYSTTIDEVVAFLQKANNGLYTNEWLLADTKTNEIAMFELGTHTSKLYRSSKGEWFGGTEGFYWGCNNTKDLQVRLETIAATNDRPANMVWNASDRDEAWIKLYRKHKGKMGVDFAKEAFTTSPICASHSADAKFTTTDLAKDMKSWAIFGPPRGETWLPRDDEKRDYPEIDPLVSNPWAIIHGESPTGDEPAVAAVDLDESGEKSSLSDDDDRERRRRENEAIPAKLVWRGTILPKTDGDIWLAAAFADYHRIVAREKGMLAISEKERLCDRDLSKLAISLFARRAQYLSGAAVVGDAALVSIRSEDASRAWYRIASGKGVLVLSELRRRLGDDKFVELMDKFGLAHAGKPAGWTEFAEAAAKVAGESLDGFFNYWVKGTGLPTFALSHIRANGPSASGENQRHRIEGVLTTSGGGLPANVEATVETDGDEVTQVVAIDSSTGAFTVESEDAPKRLVVDKYARVARANGGRFDIVSFMHDIEETIIVYGTTDDADGNRDAAEVLQEDLRMEHSNIALPIVSDAAVTEEQLKNHHVLLVGRPSANRIAERFRKAFPIRFGEQSFEVDGDFYAHPKSAVIAAGTNPLNPRYSAVVVAGLRALSTYRAASKLGFEDFGAEVKVLPHGERAKKLVVPSPELIHVFEAGERMSKAGTE